MHGLAAAECPESGYDGAPETGLEILEDIRASVRHIEMLAAQRPGDALLAAAALRVTELAVAAENLARREIIAEEIAADSQARGRTQMAVEVAARKRLRPVV